MRGNGGTEDRKRKQDGKVVFHTGNLREKKGEDLDSGCTVERSKARWTFTRYLIRLRICLNLCHR